MLAHVLSKLSPSRSIGPSIFGQGAAWLTLLPFAVYCFVYPFGILLLSFDWMPFGMEWMSSLLLGMLGLSCVGWLWANLGGLGFLLGVLIFSLGVALEYVGVLTGFPFGAYRYTGVLVPDLPGGVPLAMGFAWLAVIVGGHFTARRASPVARTRAGNVVALSLVGGLLAVGLDLLLEPVAYHVKGYWQWLPGDGAYYGIPVSNFVAWFLAAALFNLPLAFLSSRQREWAWPWLPVALYVMNVIMFGIVNLAHGFWLAGFMGLMLSLTLLVLRPARVRWP
ncbi:MAG: carotenoid biosynthesis protein [Chloroflexia bacterium]